MTSQGRRQAAAITRAMGTVHQIMWAHRPFTAARAARGTLGWLFFWPVLLFAVIIKPVIYAAIELGLLLALGGVTLAGAVMKETAARPSPDPTAPSDPAKSPAPPAAHRAA